MARRNSNIFEPVILERICGSEVYKEINFSAPIDTKLSCGKTTIIDGFTYRIISMIYTPDGKILGTGLSLNPIRKSDQPILRTSNGEESFKEPLNEFDKDVDSILEDVFKE